MKSLVASFFILLLAACAKPNYVDDRQLSGVAGCALLFTTENLCLLTEWVTRPTESSFGEMLLTFVDPADPDRAIDPTATPAIVLWMPSMGHGSSPVDVERIDVGRFRASQIFFIMSGPWDLRYQLKSGSDVVDETIQPITI